MGERFSPVTQWLQICQLLLSLFSHFPFYPLTPLTSKKALRPIRVGVDTGGTFTDFVYEFNYRLQVFKLPSNPANLQVSEEGWLAPAQAAWSSKLTFTIQVEQLRILSGGKPPLLTCKLV